MTENFPGAPDGPADGPDRPTDAPPEPMAAPTPEPPVSDVPVPPVTGAPAQFSPGMPVAHVPPSPWAQQPMTGPQPVAGPQPVPSSQQSGYHAVPPPPPPYAGYGPPTGPITSTFTIGSLPPDQPRQRRGGLIVGVVVLALVVGGLAGALGGYLVSGHTDDAGLSALDQAPPASQAANAPAGSMQSVASKVLPVVVTIAAEFQQQGNVSGDTGSGVIISTGGDILTNNHVIADAATNNGHLQVIFASGRTVDATIVGRDPTSDIAVIRAQGVSGLPIAQLGRSDDLAVGQQVVAIGAPFELSGTVTSGIISSLHRPTAAGDSSNNQTTVLDAIQTDAPINPGNSGGPLVDMQGQVIGINSAIYSPNTSSQSQGGNVGIGFAIPINQARRTADQIVQTGFATQTVLGVKVEDNMPTNNGQPSILPTGALISDVTPGGPADKAGLKTGAVIVKADGRLVTSSDGLVAAVHAAAPGDQMVLTLSTGSTVTVTLAGQVVHPS